MGSLTSFLVRHWLDMASKKENCFKEAWEKYKDTFDEKSGIEMQRPWSLNRDTGTWSQYSNWQHAMNSFWSYLRGGSGSTKQLRIPDLTITQGGKTSVVDLKFTRADGTVDSWGSKPGAGNGQLQQQDYDEINRQQNSGQSPHGDDPSLTPNKCGCGKPGGTAVAPVSVAVPELGMGKIFVMPGPLAPGVSLPPVTIPQLPSFGLPGGFGPRLVPGGLRP